MLVLALLMATVFVVLSAWQFGQSQSETGQSAEYTETPVNLTEIYAPAQPISVEQADRIVTFSGEFIPESQVLVADRLQDGEPGYWAVAALSVNGAPDGEVIPVVRGWSAEHQEISAPPSGEVEIEGRLLPTEAPGPGPRDLPAGVLPTLSVAELINLWGLDSYSGFVVDFSGNAAGTADLEPVWVDPQPEGSEVNWLNLFYAVEWVVFAAFAFYFWWRMVKDAHLKRLDEERLDREWEEQWRREQLALREGATDDAGQTGPTRHPGQEHT